MLKGWNYNWVQVKKTLNETYIVIMVMYYYITTTLIIPISACYYSKVHNAIMSYLRVQLLLMKVQ